jgi:hypothetical protein
MARIEYKSAFPLVKSAVACLFVAAEMFLQRRCLATFAFSSSNIPDFNGHVKISMLLIYRPGHVLIILITIR